MYRKICFADHTDHEGPQRGLEIQLSRRYFAQITPKYCMKFMFTPSLPNHARYRLIYHAIMQFFSSNSCFHALKCVELRHHTFPLGGPPKADTLLAQTKTNVIVILPSLTRIFQAGLRRSHLGYFEWYSDGSCFLDLLQIFSGKMTSSMKYSPMKAKCASPFPSRWVPV